MDLFEKCYQFTEAKEVMAMGIYPFFRPIESFQETLARIDGKEVIMIGSNNYLGLTHHPKVIQAARAALERYGSGCTGSRFLNGTLTLHEELEHRLARFVGKEAALVFSTGFQVNLGVISSLVGRNELTITDREDHASIVDGCRLSFGKNLKFPHGNMEALESILVANKDRPKLIIVDGVFSMGGDLADLPSLVDLARRYDARLLVDDAHGIGVVGTTGRGTAEHFGLTQQVDLIMGTFSKSFASLGGFIAGEEQVIHYIKHHSRSFIFSASMPPASVAAAMAALEVLEEEPERVQRLHAIAERMQRGFRELGFDVGGSQTAIIPIKVGLGMLGTFRFWKSLLEEGVFTNPVIPPAVTPGDELLRTSYMATHEDYQLEKVLAVFAKVGKDYGIL
ncbi:aminotransferase class I/II-fold pyridoxal phosphate-dependent enzyme [Candidatus Fermentibacteria bacterium]|nr:aminotransferase class I/II-fold pyridoxal phosphate-dependent enzyme [Candidatus Fermentibacteria bacterium]